ALVAKQAAPIVRSAQKAIGPTFPYRNTLNSRHVNSGLIVISFMKQPAKRTCTSKKDGSGQDETPWPVPLHRATI
ncbi:MAG: hypothetical protein WAK16_01430, partial [Candidatus Cybelea sp.]